MGYILPLNHEQYRQYANQVRKKNPPPFTLDPVYKPTIDAKLKRKKEERGKQEKAYGYPLMNDFEKNEKDQEIIDYHLAELTGKGQNFNELI